MQRGETTDIARHIPNALSAARIPLSLSLLFMKPFTTLFVVVYIACGLTDALDGLAARKLHAESVAGAKLDSVADFTFFAVALYVFLSAIVIPPILVAWALAVVLARLVGLARAFSKFHSWAALHTNAFRVMSFVFFCFPLLCGMFGVLVAGSTLCLIATLATVEEIYINRQSTTLDPDIRTARQLHEAR